MEERVCAKVNIQIEGSHIWQKRCVQKVAFRERVVRYGRKGVCKRKQSDSG